MDKLLETLVVTISEFVGRRLIVFTASGGVSGGGFTGVLLSVDVNFVVLVSKVGRAPECSIGSSCQESILQAKRKKQREKKMQKKSEKKSEEPTGAICLIPTRTVVCFCLY